MNEGVRDDFAEGEQRVRGLVGDAAVGIFDDGRVEGTTGPVESGVQHAGNGSGDSDLVAGSDSGWVLRQWFRSRLNDVTGKELLRVHAERQEAGHRGLPSCDGYAGSA